MITLKKRVEIIVNHLGYGGIEQAVSSFCNLLKDEVDLSILSFYRLYDKPVFPIDSSIPITYLYETELPLKMKKYHQMLKEKKKKEFFAAIFQDYIKRFHLIRLCKELFGSFYLVNHKFQKLKKHLQTTSADIYISTRYETSEILAKYGNPNSFKIGWEHNHHHGNMEYRKNVVQASSNLDRFVLVSRALTKDYQEAFRDKKCKCVYIPNMIDYNLPFISDYRDKRILMVGRLEKEKGLFDAIDIMKRLQEKMITFHFDIVGDGPLKSQLMQYVNEKGLTDFVQFHGFQSHAYIEELMKHTSLYLMTSFTESFGLVLIEAMNAGIPCLSFDSAEGAQELIQNDSNGYLIKNRNVDEMASQIIYLFQNPEIIQRLGKNAKEFSINFLPNSVKMMWLEVLGGEK